MLLTLETFRYKTIKKLTNIENYKKTLKGSTNKHKHYNGKGGTIPT